jgi:hypothetical protein
MVGLLFKHTQKSAHGHNPEWIVPVDAFAQKL